MTTLGNYRTADNCVSLLAFLIACSSCFAFGGGGKIDTIRLSRWTQASVAYHDSVVIYEEQPGVSNAHARGFTRSSPTAPWDSVDLVSSWYRQLPVKGCVMMGNRSNKEHGLHWILRGAKAARVDTTGRKGDKIDYRPIKRIRVHPANPRKVYVQYEYQSFGGIFTATMVTNDDGESWSEINPPWVSGDGGRGHRLVFNYRLPQRTYIIVNPENDASRDRPHRVYYTDDDGVSFTQVDWDPEIAPLWELGVGIWSENRGFEFIGPKLYFHIDSVASDGRRITLFREQKWLDRVRSTLIPNYDSTTQELAYGHGENRLDGYIEGFAFHPELPESFALAFRFDTLVGKKWHSRVFVAATVDMGNTWHVVVPVTDLGTVTYQYPASLNFDPSSKALYCSYQEARRDSLNGITLYLNSYTIKWTPDVVNSVDDAAIDVAHDDIVVYPNPVSRNGSITIRLPSTISSLHIEFPAVSFIAIDGRSTAATIIDDETLRGATVSSDRRTLTVRVSDLTAGVYTAVVSVGTRRYACMVIVGT